jgi:hypothetical protein
VSTGTISSPATWLVGTVLTPTWAQSVQDNINGWLNGTNSLDLGTSATGVTPLVKYRNAAGNFRTGIDHTGYPTGHIYTLNEFWPISLSSINTPQNITSTGTWGLAVGNSAGNNSINTQNGSAVYPSQSIQITVGTNASDSVNLNHAGIFHTTFTESVFEFDLYLNVVGANNVTLDVGLTLNSLFNGANHGYYFEKTSATRTGRRLLSQLVCPRRRIRVSLPSPTQHRDSARNIMAALRPTGLRPFCSSLTIRW